MTDRKPVLGRPPVDVDEGELEEWVKGFVDAILGRERDDQSSADR